MKITKEHLTAAAAFLRPSVPCPHVFTGEAAPAYASFLAAIERLEDDPDTPCSQWSDDLGDPGSADIDDDGMVVVDLTERASSAAHTLTPGEAERRGWELIALAHLARTEGSGS